MELLYLGDLDESQIQRAREIGVRLDSRFDTPNDRIIMPRGKSILYTSPLDSQYGELEWLEEQVMTSGGGEFAEREYAKPMWVLELDTETEIYRVISSGDLRRFRKTFPCPKKGWRRRGPRHFCRLDHTDWVAVSQSLDAFWLSYNQFMVSGEWWRQVNECYWFRGETVVIFNLAMITRVERLH